MPIKPMFTNEEKTQHTKCLLYGSPGVGKTSSVLTVPNLESTLIISAESGLLPLRKTKIEVWPAPSWTNFDEALMILLSKEYHEKTRLEKKQPPLETVFIDSSTEMTKKCVDHVLFQRTGIMKERGKTMNTIYEDQMTIEEWGIVKPRVDRMFRAFRDLPFNVIFTALEHTHQAEETGAKKYMPLLYPQSMSEAVPGHFDEVYRMRIAKNAEDQIVRWWETVDDGTMIAKSRLGTMKRQIEPNWSKVFNAMKGN